MCTTLNGDVTDYGFMAYALGESKPDHVFNLAGISFVPYSWHNPWLTSNVNGVAVAGILHSIDTQQKLQDRQIRLFQASTSEMLGGTDGLVSAGNGSGGVHREVEGLVAVFRVDGLGCHEDG